MSVGVIHFKVNNKALCYVMLGSFTWYLAKKVHDSMDIKPYVFRLFWGLIYHQDIACVNLHRLN